MPGNKLETIPKDLGLTLTNLNYLELSGNHISEIQKNKQQIYACYHSLRTE